MVCTALTNPIYLIVDGLDEVRYGPPRVAVLRFLQLLVDLDSHHVSVFITSRSEPDILDHFASFRAWLSIPVNQYAIADDIKRYVQQQLDRFPDPQRASAETKALITRKLCRDDNYM